MKVVLKKNVFQWMMILLFVLTFSFTSFIRENHTAAKPNILVLIADDWSYPHASVLGDPVVQTPNFDKLVKGGALFSYAYCNAPSCTPSRGSMLTGLQVHRLGEGGNLWSTLATQLATYPDVLEQNGYHTGYMGKGWGPGDVKAGGRMQNPAGKEYNTFDQFLEQLPPDKPFCFWFGSYNPHRPYEKGAGLKEGWNAQDVKLPSFYPDHQVIREDLLDYYKEVEDFDKEAGAILDKLESKGLLKNTLVVMTSDNGMPFPRAKANLYDAGTRVPLVIYWQGKIKPVTIDQFVTLRELAPTFLSVAGLEPATEMGPGLMSLIQTGRDSVNRRRVFLERERHANVREGNLSYPARAIRTHDYLYIMNLRPERWPAGDPQFYFAVGPFGDVDASPTKEFLMNGKDNPSVAPFYLLAFAKRPAEELYDLRKDPDQINNVAGDKKYSRIKSNLRKQLWNWMQRTNDPRMDKDYNAYDQYPYYGPKGR